ncbi:MAG: hypothetical protein NTV80_22525 [Verrucomicrobia bacterium]|nr:hypothetical protein [Verrucomicrobiota bacterium]
MENCPICAGLSVAVSFSASNLNPETQTRYDPPSNRDAQDTFTDALRYLRANESTGHSSQSRAERETERQRQLGLLSEWCREHGKIVSAETMGEALDQGAEHTIYGDLKRNRAIKVTYPGRAGNDFSRGRLLAAHPTEYFERWINHNELFGDAAMFEGLIEAEDGHQLVISQPWIMGDVPDRQQTWEKLAEMGFEPVPNGQDFFRVSDSLALLDCHDGNFILAEDGRLLSIDAHPIFADDSLKRALYL